MGSNSTSWQLGCTVSAVAITAILVGIPGAPVGNPEEIRQELPQRDLASEQLSVARVDCPTGVATGDLAAGAYAPAPMGESRMDRDAADVPGLPTLAIAIGRGAGDMVPPEFEGLVAANLHDAKASMQACTDRDAIEMAQTDRVDLALVADRLSVRDLNAGLRQVRIGLELFALAVADDFPLQSLTRGQMRDVLTGQAREWRPLGCDRGPIEVIVPSQPGLAERAARTLIRGDRFTPTAVRVASGRHVADQLLRNRDAIAVVRVGQALPAGVRLLQIDWTPPTPDAYDYGNYPYGVPLHVVTAGQPNRQAQQFLEFACGDNGREFLMRTLIVR